MFNKVKYWFYRLRFNHPELFRHKPVHLDLELVRACNLKCPFCYRQEPGFTSKFPNKIMDAEVALKRLEYYYAKGLRSVKFNWRGEPLLHPEICGLAADAQKIGYLDRMINTNLAMQLSDDFLSNLDAFTEIRVSLDTMVPELYAEMRTPAKLETVLVNLAEMIKRYNPRKTRLIIQRRTTEECESDGIFRARLWGKLEMVYKDIQFISKPVQPRIGVNFKYSNGGNYQAKLDSSYFEQWQAGLVDRRYCKQPSQRMVVGVDGKEWACCLAYDEPPRLSLHCSGDQRRIVDTLASGCYPSTRCYKCTSFAAYKEKK